MNSEPATMDERLTAEQRKKLLIVQGQMFRLGVLEARQATAANLRVDALVRHAASGLFGGGAGYARQLLSIDSLFNGRVAMLLPVVAKTAGFLARRRLLAPVGIAAAIGAAGYVGWRRMRERRNAARESAATPTEATADTTAETSNDSTDFSIGTSTEAR